MFPPRLPSPARSLLLVLICTLPAIPVSAQSTAHKGRSGKASPSPATSSTAAPSASPSAGYVLPDLIATIDFDSIHKADLERVAGVLLANSGRKLDALNDEDKKKVFHSVLDDMITDRLVNHEAANETVDPLDVEKRFNELRSQYPTPDGFDNEIKKSGQTADQVKQNLHIQIAQQQWIEHQVADQIKVTPEEAEKFYKEGPPSKFDAPEMVRASHILVSVSKEAPPEDALAAEQKADALAVRAKKGESFEDLAKANSDDPNAKKTGGDLDYFSRERIMPEFADVAFKLKVGEIGGPVRTQFGYHLIKVTDHKAAHTATFTEAQPQIMTYLQDEKRRDAIARLVRELREKADVKTFLP